jgi:hypothetical protein
MRQTRGEARCVHLPDEEEERSSAGTLVSFSRYRLIGTTKRGTEDINSLGTASLLYYT